MSVTYTDNFGQDLNSRLLSLMDENYTLTQINGQRIYRIYPHLWFGPEPTRQCEVFIGRIPHDCFEDSLIPLFKKAGTLYEFRLMINFSGYNRGYAFAMYSTPYEAVNAIQMFNNYTIRPQWKLGVCPSINNCRIYIARIPMGTPSGEIVRILYSLTDEVKEVLIRRSFSTVSAIVEYMSHRGAALARKALLTATPAMWGGGSRPTVDWSLPSSPHLLKQYHEKGCMTPTGELVLSAADAIDDPYCAAQSPATAPQRSYTLDPRLQERRLRMIHEAHHAAKRQSVTSNRLPGCMGVEQASAWTSEPPPSGPSVSSSSPISPLSVSPTGSFNPWTSHVFELQRTLGNFVIHD